ncbi:hypothetical protein NU195Hw_Modified_45t1 [Hortaea werneckii]
MRFPILTLLCVLLVGSCLVSAETINAIYCRRKNGDLTDLIKKFCSNNYMSVPGPYAWNGMKTPNRHSTIKINASCNPKQWVPSYWCNKQFYQMCVSGGAHGGKKAKFGRNGCQKWEIKYERHPAGFAHTWE